MYNKIKSNNSVYKKDKRKKNNEIPGEGDILEADEVDSLPIKRK